VKKKPARKTEKKLTTASASKESGKGKGAEDKTSPPARKKAGRAALSPLRWARYVGIAVLGFAGGVLGGWGGASVYLKSQNASGGQQTVSDVVARQTKIWDRVDGLSEQIAELQAASDRLEGELAAVRVPGGVDTSALAELSDRVAGLEQATATLLGGGAPLVASPRDGVTAEELSASLAAVKRNLAAFNAEVTARLAALEKSAPPGNLTQILDSLAPRSALDALETRLSALEADRSGADAKRAALALALAGLIRSADRGEPFATELHTIALLAPDRPQWKSLEPYAAQGLRPMDALTRDFDEMARRALKAERMERADNWWRRLWENIRSLVTVRRTGDLAGQSSQAIIARAGQRLKEGDVRAASRELHGLKGAAATRMAPWLSALDGRVQLDDLVSSLSADMLSELGTRDEAP